MPYELTDTVPDPEACTTLLGKYGDTVHGLLMEKYEPIAIIGIGLRFPGGCESFDEFGEFLRDGRSGIRPIPEDRWDVAAFTPDGSDDRGKIRTTSGGFLDRIDLFDPAFFNISPKEAQYVDPQQRMLLETAWQTLENANIDPTPLRRGNGGVYIGASSIDYALELDALPYAELDGHLASGITMFPLSGRLSYFLGWRGPSVSVDTACSSSLVALHMAVQGLRRGECDIALCGGVNALHHPRIPVMFSHAQMLAPDGQCKTFDEAADGYARAEGCGVIVLKRLSVARRDGDNILAVVRGTAVGQDGDSAGLTVPNGAAQEVVIRNALAIAQLAPGDIQYVEAHGTGTPLGDPIELGAINDVFAESHTKDEPLLVGSVKTNLGHMEPVSGLVGLIKVVSQLRSGTIYPHLNLHTPSGRIPWATYPVSVSTECQPWEAPVRRAVVNSFGFAGTIAAVVLEQAPPTKELVEPDSASEPAVFTMSAKSDAALRDQLQQYQRFLANHPDVDVGRLCYSGNVGRAHFNRRVAAVVGEREDLARVLDREIARTERPPAAGVRKVGFLFSGQGSQYPGMGATLYWRFPVFAERVDECDLLFAPLLGQSVRALLLGEQADAGRIDQTGYTQPALFTLEYALAQLWMSWGVRPSVLIGHSIGEVVAATVAGLFSVPDAVRLVVARARLMQSVTEPGGMAAVSAPAEEVVPLLANHTDLALAAINAPDQCVISGGAGALAKVVGTLRERAIRVDELSVSHAFHSPLMAEVLDDFRAAIAPISFREPVITLISNLTGKIAKRVDVANPEYWVRHIGAPVLFMEGMRAAARRGRHAFIEIGPSTALTALAKRCLQGEDHLWFASLHRRDRAGNTTLRSLAELYTAGMPVSWASVHANRRLEKLALPTYPFQRKRCWLPINGAAKTGRGPVTGGPVHHPLLGQEVPAAEGRPAGSREFRTECSATRPEYLADYVVDGSVMLPAAGYVEALLALQDAVYGHTGRVIRDLVLHEPLSLAEDAVVALRTRLVPTAEGDVDVELVSTVDDQERRHATATLATAATPAVPCDRLRALLDEAGATEEVVGHEDIYTDFASVDRRYGQRFRLLTEVRANPEGVLTADLGCRDAAAVEHLPVEVLDGAMQALTAVDRDGPVFSPTGVEAVRLFKKPRGRRLRLVAKVRAGRSDMDDRRVADLLLLEGEAPVAELTGVMLTRATGSARHGHFLHRLSWLRQSATTQPTIRARHVVVVNGDRYRLPELAEQEDFVGIRVSTVDGVVALPAALADPSVTDACWFWRPAGGAVSADRLRTECEQNYRELLDVVAALDGAPSRALRLWLVTEGAQLLPVDRPDGGERLAASSLWGFGPTLLNEYPRYGATLVDLPADSDPSALLAEWRAENTDEFQVAYRDGQRYVRRLLADETTPALAGEFAVRADRTYLVTGGLGGLGLVTARKLVDLGARHVALLSRRGTPTPEASGVLDALSERAEVTVLSADIASADDVARVFAQLRAGEHPLGGIVHAAGEIGKSLISSLTWDVIDEQLRPKMYGGWLLHEASRDLPDLDFFVVYSSIASVIGGVTQAHYAAASAFLDGLATWRERQGLPGLATNWGAWASVGMSARLDDNLSREVERGGIRFFSPARGLRALGQLLSRSVAQRVVGEYDWDRIARAASNVNALYSRLARRAETPDSGLDLTALLAKPKAERLAVVTELVRGKVAAALHCDDAESVDTTAELVSLGFDSLMAMEVKSGLESAFRLALPASLAFDYPSVQQLTEFVNGQLAAEPTS